MEYSAAIFTFGTRSSDELESLRNGDNKWAKLFDDIHDVKPEDGYERHYETNGEFQKIYDLRPPVGRRGSTQVVYVPTRAKITSDEVGRARIRVEHYLPLSKEAIGIGFIGAHDSSYEHGHALLPKRAIISNILKNRLKKLFKEESVCGYADTGMQNNLYSLCNRENLPAHLVNTTFSVADEKETFRYDSTELFELGYAGRDMEIAWFLSFANRHSKPAGAMLIVSDTVKDGKHENPFGDPRKGQELFTVPQIAKENTRKSLYIVTHYVLNRI